MHKRQKSPAPFVIPRRHAAQWFEVIEEPFDLVAQRVEVVIRGDGLRPIAPGWDHRHPIVREEVLADRHCAMGIRLTRDS